MFVDSDFVPLIERLAPRLKDVREIVVLTDAAHIPESGLKDLIAYESFIHGRRG